MSDVSKSVTGSLISAVLIAVLFGLWNDYIYKNDKLTGYWKVESETIESSYSKYRVIYKTLKDQVMIQVVNLSPHDYRKK